MAFFQRPLSIFQNDILIFGMKYQKSIWQGEISRSICGTLKVDDTTLEQHVFNDFNDDGQ